MNSNAKLWKTIANICLWAILIVLVASGIAKGDPIPLPIRARILDEGGCKAIVGYENLVLAGSGTVLLVLDASDPEHLVRVGKLMTDDEINSIAIRDNIAFLANNYAGLTVVDFAVASQPLIIERIPTQTRAFDVAVDGSFAYVTDKGYGLNIYDVSNPDLPVRISGFQMFEEDLEGRGAISVRVFQQRAIVGTLDSLSVINIENPHQPVLASRISGAAYDIEIQDTVAYVATNMTGRLASYNLSNPNVLFPLDWVQVGDPALKVSIAGYMAYVAGEQGGLTVVDISDPANLVQVVRYDPADIEYDVQGVYARGDVTFFCSYAHGVYSFPVSQLPEVEVSLAYEAGNSPQRMDSEGGRLFVANYYRGLTEVNIWDPIPTEIYSVGRPGTNYTYTNGVALYHRADTLWAITADNNRGMRILDVTDRFNPVAIDSQQFQLAKDAAVMGNMCFVTGSSNFYTYDLSAPRPSATVSVRFASDSQENVVAENGFVYLACHEEGLKIFDINNGFSTVTVTDYVDVADVEVLGQYAYLALLDAGIAILDVSSMPPMEVARVPYDGSIVSVDIEENLLFATARTQGLLIFDVTRLDSIHAIAYRDGIGDTGFIEIADLSTSFETEKVACISSYVGGVTLVNVTGLFDSSRTSMIVAGGGNAQENFAYFQRNTNLSTNFAYNILAGNRSYGRKVKYMNPQSWQDLNGDNIDDQIVTSSTMTVSSLRENILTLEDSRNSLRPNVLFFSGHGHFNEFDVSGDPLQKVTADSLGSWIDQARLDVETPLVVVIEACNAGSFKEELSVGRSNRILIASGLDNETCYFLDGKSFSTEFWRYVWQGENLANAFGYAQAWVYNNIVGQHPGLDANGNGVFNEGQDFDLARNVFIGGNIQGGATLPVILDSVGNISSYSDTLTIAVTCSLNIESFWYRMYPCNGQHDPSMSMWGRMEPGAGYRYAAQLTGLYELGGEDFIIEYNALDENTNLALPHTVLLHVGEGEPPRTEIPHYISMDVFPNPFNANVNIRFLLNTRTRLSVDVYNILGQKAAVLADQTFESGLHSLLWDGTNYSGVPLSSGVYFVRLRAENKYYTQKILMLR